MYVIQRIYNLSRNCAKSICQIIVNSFRSVDTETVTMKSYDDDIYEKPKFWTEAIGLQMPHVYKGARRTSSDSNEKAERE